MQFLLVSKFSVIALTVRCSGRPNYYYYFFFEEKQVLLILKKKKVLLIKKHDTRK